MRHYYWEQLAKESLAYLAASDDNDLGKEIKIATRGKPLHFFKWQALVQAFVHSTHHRGELSIILTELGAPLPTLDILIQFARESGQHWPAV